MTSPADQNGNTYLWDRSGPIDPVVADLERRLSPLGFDPGRQPLVSRPARRRLVRALVFTGAIAAAVLLVTGLFVYRWRLDWPANRAWSVATQTAAGQPSPPAQLAVGQSLEVAPSTSARIDVARLGTIDASPGTVLTLTSTDAQRHRVSMTRGSVSVRLWAPPGAVAIQTPAGNVRDLGCIFQLVVDDQGSARLSVETGWVQIDNRYGESLIPAGASSTMRADRRPLVPIYDDASSAFLTSVRALERADTDETRRAYVGTIGIAARPRDVLTLLMLAVRLPGGDIRSALVDRAGALSPPPADVTLDAARADDAALWRWREALPLPPIKSWWRNWRDGLPRRR
jgi:hypothetical protein